MRRVVEIGCGAEAGPFFEGASEHFIVDRQGDAVGAAYLQDPRLTPRVADATNLDFDDASVDTVLARNVFGDAAIFMNSFEKLLLNAMLDRLEEQDLYEKAGKQLETIEARSGLIKGDIMRETARILRVGGQLIAIEQLTPKDAEKFFDRAAEYCEHETDFDLSAAFDIEQGVPLGEVTPPNYARAHDGPETHTWVATRK